MPHSDGHPLITIPLHDIWHYRYIDCVRGIAIILVLIVHAFILSDGPSFFFIGQRGVQLFYIVSAFTLIMSMHGRSGERHWLVNYFIRRYFRVAPMFYFALALNVLYIWLCGGLGFSNISILIGVLMLHGFSPELINAIVLGGWSVGVEFAFYLILPIVFLNVRSLKSSFILLVGSLVICGYVSYRLKVFYPALSDYFTFFWFVVEFPVFVMGIFSFYLLKHIKLFCSSAKHKHISLLIVTLGLVLFVSIPTNNETMYVSSFCLVLFLIGLSLYQWKLFVNNLMSFIGKISYSIYLLHFFIIIGLERTFEFYKIKPNTDIFLCKIGWSFIVFLVVFLISLPIAYLTWRYIETPFIRLGGKIVSKLEN